MVGERAMAQSGDLLTVKGLQKVFHPRTPDSRVALDDIHVSLCEGDFAIVIGSNGAGKSTLLNALAGEVAVDAGTIRIAGNDISALPAHRRAPWIARVFQDPAAGTAGSMTVEENLAVSELRGRRRGLRGSISSANRARFREALAPLGLGLESRLGSRVSALSGGQRQCLSLLMAVLRRPSLLLLDEHTAALDPRTAELVMNATVSEVLEKKLTCLMVTHNMEHALRYGNRLIMMRAGKIALDLREDEKGDLTVEKLVEKFGLSDDKMLLAS